MKAVVIFLAVILLLLGTGERSVCNQGATTAGPDQSGDARYAELVVERLSARFDRFEDKLDNIHTECVSNKVAIGKLQTKASIWGAGAGFAISAVFLSGFHIVRNGNGKKRRKMVANSNGDSR